MSSVLIDTIVKLKHYCEKEQFKGWDPYDGLNSKLFMSIPLLKKNSYYRLAVIQLFKRNPFNLRRIALVPKDYNAKGIGLLLQGYCNLYQAVLIDSKLTDTFGTKKELMAQIDNLASLLISLRSQGNYHGACWGYNFDWQNRTGFNFPKYTPTVVATGFCATALMSACL